MLNFVLIQLTHVSEYALARFRLVDARTRIHRSLPRPSFSSPSMTYIYSWVLCTLLGGGIAPPFALAHTTGHLTMQVSDPAHVCHPLIAFSCSMGAHQHASDGVGRSASQPSLLSLIFAVHLLPDGPLYCYSLALFTIPPVLAAYFLSFPTWRPHGDGNQRRESIPHTGRQQLKYY